MIRKGTSPPELNLAESAKTVLKWDPLYTFALGLEEKPSRASSNGVESDWSIQDRPFRAHTTPEYTGIRMTLTVYIHL